LDYPWYELVAHDEPLQQRDIFFNCPIVSLPSVEPLLRASTLDSAVEWPEALSIQIADIIVLTHSCDLVKPELDRVMVCPHTDAMTLAPKREQRSNIRKGRVLAYHLIESCDIDSYTFGQRVIDFRLLSPLPKRFLEEFSLQYGNRIRLLPPYREKMAQSFANYFGRIGLPKDPRDI